MDIRALNQRCEELATDSLARKEFTRVWEHCLNNTTRLDSAAVEQAAREIWVNNGKPKEAVLSRFEKQVMAYIQWAKWKRGL